MRPRGPDSHGVLELVQRAEALWYLTDQFVVDSADQRVALGFNAEHGFSHAVAGDALYDVLRDLSAVQALRSPPLRQAVYAVMLDLASHSSELVLGPHESRRCVCEDPQVGQRAK